MNKLIALLALSPLILTACGSEASGGKDPDDSDAARVKFEQCLRDSGINVESDPGEGGRATRITMKRGQGPSPARFGRIQEDCRKKSGFKPQPPSEADQAKIRDAALKFARCMRSKGIDMPDPQVGPGEVGILQKGPTGVNPESPRFKAAQQECQKYMPEGRMAQKAP